MADQQEFKHIVRFINTDLDGNKPILQAIRKMKGISFMYANLVCTLANVDFSKKAGYLADADLKRVEDVVKNPLHYPVPRWIMNRRFDYEEGIDKHATGSDLTYTTENDIKLMRKIKSYKGLRHGVGLPVRGQRTKSNFRKNKGKVQGVVKKASAPKK